jgi:hypothetical protein
MGMWGILLTRGKPILAERIGIGILAPLKAQIVSSLTEILTYD